MIHCVAVTSSRSLVMLMMLTCLGICVSEPFLGVNISMLSGMLPILVMWCVEG